jgi:hypothetical protein
MKQYIVDAFTDRIFHGNPAAVCVMDAWLSDEVMQAIAAENNISTRTLYRYEKIYREQGFGGLKPQQRIVKPLPKDFASIVEECIQLKREVPLRSVNQIILILEMEGKVAPGVLKRSTIQKHLKRRLWQSADAKIHPGQPQLLAPLLEASPHDAGPVRHKVRPEASHRQERSNGADLPGGDH